MRRTSSVLNSIGILQEHFTAVPEFTLSKVTRCLLSQFGQLIFTSNGMSSSPFILLIVPRFFAGDSSIHLIDELGEINPGMSGRYGSPAGRWER